MLKKERYFIENSNYYVYTHTNLINNKIYVGITMQKPEKRWLNGLGYIKNHDFYSDIQKYGWDNFKHEILYENLSLENACLKESDLIQHYRIEYPSLVYNLTSGGMGSQNPVNRKVIPYIKNDSLKAITKEEYLQKRDVVDTNSLFYIKNNSSNYQELEIWKPVVGYEEYYEVSNFGRVRSLDRWVKHRHKDCKAFKKGKMLNEKDNGHGYKAVHLTVNRITKDYYIHRLVAMAFLPNPNNLPEVNHKDDNPANNCLDNLEWCTAQYNDKYGIHKYASSKETFMFTINGNYIDCFVSCTEAERITGAKGVSAVCSGRRKSAGGYIWRYKQDVELVEETGSFKIKGGI